MWKEGKGVGVYFSLWFRTNRNEGIVESLNRKGGRSDGDGKNSDSSKE